jgi:hypothetical protein
MRISSREMGFLRPEILSFDGGKEDQDNVWQVPRVAKGEKNTGLVGVRLETERMAEVERAAEGEDRPLQPKSIVDKMGAGKK